ncbi:MAG: right-handed parallel beta-helix repeat-containing protein [Planctomycetes bacterium]|nr:right-handed parallel beta-helix repeat-containing protein [Planctomycetota bacterium]
MITLRRHSLPFLLFAAACSSGGGGDDTQPTPITPPPPPPAAQSPHASGIIAAAAGSGEARLDVTLPGAGFEAALFQGGSRGAVYSGAPVVDPVTTSPVMVGGLSDGVDVFFGLAIRPAGSSTWSPVGASLRVRPAAPIYVDAGADPGVANGQTPQTAFPSLFDGMLVAGSQNGGNVWVRAGEYRSGPFPLGPDVHVAGGFDATFSLAGRDVAAHATVLAGSTGLQVVDVISGGGDASLDGLRIDGEGTVTEAIDITDSDVELRSLLVRGGTDRGIRAKVTTPTPNRRLLVVACTVTANGTDGLSSAGPIDLRLDQSRFDANGQEGADIDDLQAPSGGAVSLHATACRFYGNVFEGLDADLSAAPAATAPGTFDVRLENCTFELNGLEGLLVDQEHELNPGFAATIVVRGCTARGNRGAGVHIDADALATYRLERLRCTANGGDGVLITAESHAGEVVLSASWLAGNRGYGARVGTGNKALLATHCAIAGNDLGGISSAGAAAALVDSVLLGQPNALANTHESGNVIADLDAAVFVNAPSAMATVSAHNQGTITAGNATGFAIGSRVEIGDDDTAMMVNSTVGNDLVLDRVPSTFHLPGAIWAYATDDVEDDLRLVANSPAAAAGVAAAGAAALDCGPHGAANGGAPGHIEAFAGTTMHLFAASPALATGVGATEPIVLTFDREVAAASVLDRVVVLHDGAPVVASIHANRNQLSLLPTGSGWPGALTILLHSGLAADDGSPLAAPLLLPTRLR